MRKKSNVERTNKNSPFYGMKLTDDIDAAIGDAKERGLTKDYDLAIAVRVMLEKNYRVLNKRAE